MPILGPMCKEGGTIQQMLCTVQGSTNDSNMPAHSFNLLSYTLQDTRDLSKDGYMKGTMRIWNMSLANELGRLANGIKK